jgi:hypothetical protein
MKASTDARASRCGWRRAMAHPRWQTLPGTSGGSSSEMLDGGFWVAVDAKTARLEQRAEREAARRAAKNAEAAS